MFDGMPLQRVAALAPPLWARSDGRRPGARASTVHEGGEEYHADHCTDFGRQVPPESSSSSLPAGGGKWNQVDPLRFCRLGCRLDLRPQGGRLRGVTRGSGAVRVQVITGGSSTGSTQQQRRHGAWAQ